MTDPVLWILVLLQLAMARSIFSITTNSPNGSHGAPPHPRNSFCMPHAMRSTPCFS